MLNACSRYRKYKLLCEDGMASLRKQAFVQKHESTCPGCAAEHFVTMTALSALRGSVIEPEPDPTFESRFIRRWRVESRARAVSYWMPAVAGAVVASIALLAVLQILLAAPSADKADISNREAVRDDSGPEIPLYEERYLVDPHR